MTQYTIAKISQIKPRSWSFADKRTGADVQMETYKVMVEGEDDPIDINRKPGNAPTVGEVLAGTLEDTDFGKKFKPERKPFTPGAGRDQAEIKAQWAIGTAVRLLKADGSDIAQDAIERWGRTLFEMVGRVKTGTPSGYEKAKEQADKIKQTFGDGSPIPTDEPVNIDDIPF